MKNKLIISIILLFSLTIPSHMGAKPAAPISVKKTKIGPKKTAPAQGDAEKENVSWKDYFGTLATTQNLIIAGVITVIVALIIKKLLKKDPTLYFTSRAGVPITVMNREASPQRGATCGYHAVKNLNENLRTDDQFSETHINTAASQWRQIIIPMHVNANTDMNLTPDDENYYAPDGSNIDEFAIRALIEAARNEGLLPAAVAETIDVLPTIGQLTVAQLANLRSPGRHRMILRTVITDIVGKKHPHWIAIIINRQANQTTYEWVDSVNSDYCYPEVVRLMRVVDDVPETK